MTGMVEVATPEKVETMLGQLPSPVKVLWHLVGKRKYRRYITPVHGGSPREPREGVTRRPSPVPSCSAWASASRERTARRTTRDTARCGRSSASPPTATGPSSAGPHDQRRATTRLRGRVRRRGRGRCAALARGNDRSVAGAGPAAGRARVLDRLRAAVRTAARTGAHRTGNRHPRGQELMPSRLAASRCRTTIPLR